MAKSSCMKCSTGLPRATSSSSATRAVSDGRGNAFMDLRGKYGTVDYSDLMTFTDLVLKTYPMIDEKLVAVTGGGYGGFMTNWIIGHTDRFVCAASQRSISNWFSKSLTTDIGYYHNMNQMDSTPWENPEKMWGLLAAEICG